MHLYNTWSNNVNKLCCVIIPSAVILLWLGFVHNVIASPEEDMADGIKEFNRGDIGAALTYFRKAAVEGYAPAQSRLAYILDNSEENEEAFEWYKKAAEAGDAEGQYGLGEMYVSGDAGEKDFSKAVHWISKAAEQGDMGAIRSLVIAYERGGLNLKVDHKKAVKLLEQAAGLGDSWAISRLSAAYTRGELGLPVDSEKAKSWSDRLNKSTKDPEQ